MVRRLMFVALVVALATGAAPRPFKVATWLDAGVDPPLLPPAPAPSEPDHDPGRQPHPFRATAFPGEFDEPSTRPDPPPRVQRWGLTDLGGQRWESDDKAALESWVAQRDAQFRATVPAFAAGPTCGPGGCPPTTRSRSGFR